MEPKQTYIYKYSGIITTISVSIPIQNLAHLLEFSSVSKENSFSIRNQRLVSLNPNSIHIVNVHVNVIANTGFKLFRRYTYIIDIAIDIFKILKINKQKNKYNTLIKIKTIIYYKK